MDVYAVEYQYATDAEALAEHRPAHRGFLRALSPDLIVVAGAYQSGDAPGALLVVRTDDPAQLERTLDEDPFHKQGLITRRTIRLWNPAIGSI